MSSSSSRNTTSSSNQTIQETVNNVDNRVASGDGSIGGNVTLNLGAGASNAGSINVETTDYGAVQAGLSLGLKSLDNAAEAARQNTQLTQDTVAKTIALAGNTANVASATSLQAFIKYLGIALIVALGGYALAKAAPALKG